MGISSWMFLISRCDTAIYLGMLLVVTWHHLELKSSVFIDRMFSWTHMKILAYIGQNFELGAVYNFFLLILSTDTFNVLALLSERVDDSFSSKHFKLD